MPKKSPSPSLKLRTLSALSAFLIGLALLSISSDVTSYAHRYSDKTEDIYSLASSPSGPEDPDADLSGRPTLLSQIRYLPIQSDARTPTGLFLAGLITMALGGAYFPLTLKHTLAHRIPESLFSVGPIRYLRAVVKFLGPRWWTREQDVECATFDSLIAWLGGWVGLVFCAVVGFLVWADNQRSGKIDIADLDTLRLVLGSSVDSEGKVPVLGGDVAGSGASRRNGGGVAGFYSVEIWTCGVKKLFEESPGDAYQRVSGVCASSVQAKWLLLAALIACGTLLLSSTQSEFINGVFAKSKSGPGHEDEGILLEDSDL
ncbi:hypothetical protein AAFC00_003976 [Neodothiora populina]|uniref:Uncharacterized protein n=1 Tax=Neodothiora populina TaxID=2781224 RepID=A0ABR3PI78_9PEZI